MLHLGKFLPETLIDTLICDLCLLSPQTLHIHAFISSREVWNLKVVYGTQLTVGVYHF